MHCDSTRSRFLCIGFLAVCLSPVSLSAATCNTINPSKTFVGNFDTPCYALPLTGGGSGTQVGGDSNATYYQMFYQVAPGYDLVFLGTFPNARFLSATLYDSHVSPVAAKWDYQLPPLTSAMSNPFVPGATYTAGQKYGFVVSFGGTVTRTPLPGCSVGNTTIQKTVLNATQIHQGMSWNGSPYLPVGFPDHVAGANSSGMVMIRYYISISSQPAPVVIVRDLSTGCGIPVAQAQQLNIISGNAPQWTNQSQISDHRQFASTIQPTLCYPFDPDNQVTWIRSSDWVGRNNSAAAYVSAVLDPNAVASLLAGSTYLRIQFPLPTYPSTPCPDATCTRTGYEQLRYFSLEFSNTSSTILAIADKDLVQDAQGNVTLIASFGAPPLAWTTPANFYTWVDMTKVTGYQALSSLVIRNLLPSSTFNCSGFNVPYYTMVYNSEGGFTGAYTAKVDFPTADQIPSTPVAERRADTCSAVPPPPTACYIPRTTF